MFRMLVKTSRLLLTSMAILAATAAAAHAQWEPYPWKNVPRTADGKVDMNAPARRTADGKPDLSGFWMPVEAVKHLLNLAADLKPGEVPLQPWAESLYKERIENEGKDHPGVRCWPSGIPEKNNIPDGLKVVQTPGQILIIYESNYGLRTIYTDGRALPPQGRPQPFWHGYSVGRWEGDTLVVDVTNFVDGIWFDRSGNFHSDGLHVVERFTRTGPDHLLYEATIEDPKTFSKPWKMSMPLYRRKEPNLRVLEYECYTFFTQGGSTR